MEVFLLPLADSNQAAQVYYIVINARYEEMFRESPYILTIPGSV